MDEDDDGGEYPRGGVDGFDLEEGVRVVSEAVDCDHAAVVVAVVVVVEEDSCGNGNGNYRGIW